MRGFLPASPVHIRRVQDLDEFLGQELRAKVIQLNRSRNPVVLSRRAVLEEERKDQRQQILDQLQPGDVVEGQISNIVDFGAFVDLNGMDGLIDIWQLSALGRQPPLRDVHETLDARQDLHEGAERDDLRHASLDDVVLVVVLEHLLPRIALGLLEAEGDPLAVAVESTP